MRPRHARSVPEIIFLWQFPHFCKLDITRWIFCQENIIMLRGCHTCSKNRFDPFIRNPRTKKIRHRTHENISAFLFPIFCQLVPVKRRPEFLRIWIPGLVFYFNADAAIWPIYGFYICSVKLCIFPEPFRNLPRVTIRAFMITSSDGIPCAVCPFNFCFFHFLFSLPNLPGQPLIPLYACYF